MRYLYYQKILMRSNAVSEEKDLALAKFYQQSLFYGKPGVCQS